MLEMDYSGNSFGMVEQGIIDVTMSYTRALNSAFKCFSQPTSMVNATFIQTTMLTPIVNESGYDVIEFNLDITYEGTETSDVLTVGGSTLSSADSEDWNVEVFDGENWTNSREITLGIGESMQDDSVSNMATVKMRITLPDVNSSLSLDNGH